MLTIICPGWGEPRVHEPEIIGKKSGEGETHGMCGECRIHVRGLERVRLTAMIHERVISYVTDRLGAALRLKMAKKLDGFKDYLIEVVP